LIDEIRISMKKINELSKDIQERQGIQKKVKEISDQIDQGFESAEDFHKQILGLADKSEEFHQKFTHLRKEIRERQRQNSWMEHRIKMHSENLNYWESGEWLKANEEKRKKAEAEAKNIKDKKALETLAGKQAKKKAEAEKKKKQQQKKQKPPKKDDKKKEEKKKPPETKKKEEKPAAKKEEKKEGKPEPKEEPKEEPTPNPEPVPEEKPEGGDDK